MNLKSFCSIAWALSSCLFLWLISLAQESSSLNPSALGELFYSFIMFLFLLFGCGSAYHIFIEILLSPYNEENMHQWQKLSKVIFCMVFFLLTVPLVIWLCREILLGREYVSIEVAYLLSLFYTLIGFFIALFFLKKAMYIFNKIKLYVAPNILS